MRLRGVFLGALLVMTTAAGAQEFSRRLTAEEFAAAGLNQLTPAQLARLDALVREQQNGEVKKATETARVETKAAVRAEVEQEVKAQHAETKPAPAGFFARAKILLTPGTEVEYTTLDSELVGDFKGFKPGSTFTLANGQQWQVVSGSYVSGVMPGVRKVRVEPGVLGSFFLKFEGVNARPKVKLVSKSS